MQVVHRIRKKSQTLLDSIFKTPKALQKSLDFDLATASRVSLADSSSRSGHLLVPTLGRGNIGDQAMLEAFIDNTRSPVTLLVQDNASHQIPVEARERVTRLVVRDLFSTRPWVRRRNTILVASTISKHASFSIMGADIMDGGYDAAESVIRFGMLCMSNRLGVPSRVLGFSWNGTPPTTVRSALMASQPQSMLCLRDPHSLKRIQRQSSVINAVAAADMVFTMTDVNRYDRSTPWFESQGDRTVVVMNISGLLAQRGIDEEQYCAIAEHLLRRDCSILVLPHVIRTGDDDLEACRKFVSRIGRNDHIYLVDELLSPRQVAWLTVRSRAVVTGRMHLSILALNHGIPSTILSTQGKVAGLLEMLDLADLCLEPSGNFAADAIVALDRMLDEPSVRARLRVKIPKVRALAKLNFAGLD